MKGQRLVLAVLCLLGLAYVAFARQWISSSMRDQDFSEYATRLVQTSAADYREPKEVRTLLLVKAEQLQLPFGNLHLFDGILRSPKVISTDNLALVPFPAHWMLREQNQLGVASNLGSAYQFNLSSDRFVSGGRRVNEVTASLDIQEAKLSFRVNHRP